MLVLTRTIDEKITIGKDIVLMITSIEGNRIKIGVDAPKEIPIRLEQSPTHLKLK